MITTVPVFGKAAFKSPLRVNPALPLLLYYSVCLIIQSSDIWGRHLCNLLSLLLVLITVDMLLPCVDIMGCEILSVRPLCIGNPCGLAESTALKGKEREKKHQCVVASRTPPTGDLAHNPGLGPDWGIQPLTSWFTGQHPIH